MSRFDDKREEYNKLIEKLNKNSDTVFTVVLEETDDTYLVLDNTAMQHIIKKSNTN